MELLITIWEYIKSFCSWVNKNQFAAQVFGGLIVVILLGLFGLRRFLKKRKKIIENDFPFDIIKPIELDNLLIKDSLTYCKNPFVPKDQEFIYKSTDHEHERRKMFIGGAEIGKTRTAYEWILSITKEEPIAFVLIPKKTGMPDLINKNNMPKLTGMVVLFYDDINESLFKGSEEKHHEGGGSILSPVERFEENIGFLREKYPNLYIVCTARWEYENAIKSIEKLQKVWRTFDIITLKNAPVNKETEMIKKLAEHLSIDVNDEVIKEMADINKGHSYENTVTFMLNKKKITDQDINEYSEKASERWEKEVFYHLQCQKPLVAQIVGAMYTLKFELGLPLYKKFILTSAEIETDGLFKKNRLKKALNLLCKHEFSIKGDIVSCYDYQLEIEGKKTPSRDDCLNSLYNRKSKLSQDEQNSLAEYYFYNGLAFYKKGEIELSAKEWEKSIILKPDYHEAYNNWGNAFSDLAKLNNDESLYEQSIEKYQKAVEIKPDYHEAYNNWGVAFSYLAKLKNDESLYEQSFEKYQKAVEIKPDKHEAYNNWGAALYDLAKLNNDESLYEQSIEKYRKAVEIKPDFHEAYNNWGNAFSDLAKLKNDESLYKQSFEKYQKAVEIKPDKHEAYNNWGNAFSDLAKLKNDESLYEQSIEKYQKAVEIKPDFHEAYNNWGNAFSDLAKLKNDESLYEQSIEKYQKAVEIKPNYHEAYSNWGLALYDLARLKNDESLYKQSFEKYQKAVEFKPDFHEAYSNWGVALSALARLKNDESLYKQSFEKYQKAVEFKPDFHEAYSNWGVALSALVKLKNDESLFMQGIEKFQKAVNINPKYESAYFNMACAYALMKRVKEACDSLDRAISISQEVFNKVQTDSDFDPIRDDPIFQQWLQQHSKKEN